jgi:hypothetical protein
MNPLTEDQITHFKFMAFYPSAVLIVQNIKFEKFPTKPGGESNLVVSSLIRRSQAKQNSTAAVDLLTYSSAPLCQHSEQYYADKRKNYPSGNEREEGKEFVFQV